MRPSTFLRIERFNALVAELSVRDLGSLGAATLLKCSPSSARNYLLELMDAGIIGTSTGARSGAGIDRTVYCLSADKVLVGAFLANLSDGRSCDELPCRDPLVAALFGTPRAAPGSDERA